MVIIKLLGILLLIALGIFFILFGGMDDSPGAQGLGVLSIIIAVIIFIKSKKKKSK